MTAFTKCGLVWGLLLGASPLVSGQGLTGASGLRPAQGVAVPQSPAGLRPDRAGPTSPAASRAHPPSQTSIVTGAAPVAQQQHASRAPANDDCANAYAFDLLLGSLVVFQDDNTGATNDCPALSATYREAWYKFTTYETLSVVIKYCGTTPAFYNAYIVFDTTCPSSGSFLYATGWDNTSRGDGNWTLTWSNLAPGTYHWPLLTDSSGGYAEGPYTVTFDATAPLPGQECPADTLYGQSPYDQGGAWGAYTSAVGPDFEYTCYDNLPGVTGLVGGVHWWGLALIFDPSYGWLPCGDPSFTFEIAYYADDAGYPGEPLYSLVTTPTVTDLGPFSWTELYYFSAEPIVPCCAPNYGWISIKSQAQYAGCVFLWLNSPTGDFSAYQLPAGGTFGQLGTNLAFCLTSSDAPGSHGACCDDTTGECYDFTDGCDCLPPLRFAPCGLCAELEPPCDTMGACCDDGLNCVGTMFEAECDAVGGRFYPGQTCPEWVCPNDCEHRVDLYDCYGDGWNGNTLDVLVDGVTVLSQITLPSGAGPATYNFMAATGNTIQTIYYPIGGWPYEPYYYIYDGLGFILGQDGIVGSDCYQQPTGVTVTGNCNPYTTGACCYFAGGCDMVPPEQCDPAIGLFLGLGHQCFECPCYVPCPPGALDEPEPCGEDTDGGCGMAVPTFVPIACGDTICGTLWATTEEHDTDWYEVVTSDWNYFTWIAECQIPVQIVVLQAGAGGDCTDYTVLGDATAGECQTASITTFCSGPGTYWFWVGPSSWNNWPCDKNYTASLTCEPCTPPPCGCVAGAQICDEYISRVQMDLIDNPSGCEAGQYADYTYLGPAMMAYGAPTQLTVTNGNPIWTADTCSVWVDWNHDHNLDDSPGGGEAILPDIPGVGPYVFNITPPPTALPGAACLRIRIDYANYDPDPCGTTTYGEVEDYTVNVVEVSGACCWPDNTCSSELPSACGGLYGGPFTTCASVDCQANGVDDFCDIASGYSTDCDHNGVPDECQPLDDCNENGIRDFCDIADGTSQDCNGNAIPDECDIANGTSLDCQPNGIPDECDLMSGCGWQIDDGSSENAWGLPDAGELCWMNHLNAARPGHVEGIAACFGSPYYPGSSGVSPGQSFRVYVWSDPNQDGNPSDADFLGEATGTVEANSIDTDVVQAVALADPIQISGSFFIGVSVVTGAGGAPAPADDDGWTGPPDQGFLTFNSIPFDPTNIAANLYPMSELGYPTSVFIVRTAGVGSGDCNRNDVPDECDVPPICQGPDCSQDCNGDLIPDECQLGCGDCNGNTRPDDCDIASGSSLDCDGNGIPDECDINPADPDCNGQVSPDCNYNGIPDECDIASAFSQDCQLNGIPDECDVADGTSCDCQGDGIPDECQLWTWAGRNLLQWDDGSSENALGLPAGGELCWLTHFSGASMVTVIQTCFGTPMYAGTSGVSAGQPFRVYVWSDPNGDGDPTDAVFLGQASATVQAGSIDSDVFQLIPVNVNVADSFFVGVSVVTTWGYPAPMDEDGQQHDQAWIAFNTVPFDPTNLGPQLYNTTDIGYPCNWLLRAEVIPDYPCMPNDCNGNAVPDECDIGVQWDGYCTTPGIPCFPTECVSDWNHNGIPDTCELCGDLDYDGNVDLDDYWTFLDAFGTCAGDPKYNPWADMDGDGCITLLDYQAWRVCYKMANGKDFVAPKPKPMPAPAPKAPQAGAT